MRRYIEVKALTCDVTLESKKRIMLYPFQWVTNPTGLQRYIYGEIIVPTYVSENTLRQNGMYVTIPYTPKYKEFMVRVKRMIGSTSFVYLQNPIDGSDWFTAKVGMYGRSAENAFASQLMLISEKSLHVMVDGGNAMLYDADELDFNIVKANKQNGNMLLKCVPTNNYRYPVTGVGLVRWTNSNIEYTSLSEILQREFQDDGVTVMDASYDFNTKDLYLDLDTTFVDLE